jgi:hypothetical protein
LLSYALEVMHSTHRKGHARHDVLWFDLSQNQSRQDRSEEDGEDTVLERLERVIEPEKGETDDKRDGNVREEAGPLVVYGCQADIYLLSNSTYRHCATTPRWLKDQLRTLQPKTKTTHSSQVPS